MVQQVKEWRRKWKNREPFGAYEAVPPGPTVEAVADDLDAEFVDDPVELAEFISKRLKAIKEANADEFARLLRLWPEGQPTKKAEFKTVEQCESRADPHRQVRGPAGPPIPRG